MHNALKCTINVKVTLGNNDTSNSIHCGGIHLSMHNTSRSFFLFCLKRNENI